MCMHKSIDRPHCLRHTTPTDIRCRTRSSCSHQDHQHWPSTNLTNAHSAATTLCCLFYWRPSPRVRKCRRHARLTTLLSTTMPSIYSQPLGEFLPLAPPSSPPPPTLPPGSDGPAFPFQAAAIQADAYVRSILAAAPNRTSSLAKVWAASRRERNLSTETLMGTQFIWSQCLLMLPRMQQPQRVTAARILKWATTRRLVCVKRRGLWRVKSAWPRLLTVNADGLGSLGENRRECSAHKPFWIAGKSLARSTKASRPGILCSAKEKHKRTHKCQHNRRGKWWIIKKVTARQCLNVYSRAASFQDVKKWREVCDV